jgi:choline dehydrogenase
MRPYTQLPFLLLALGARAQDEAYDFVIAGAGTAGLVVANRLSADPSITVAVIDPGDDARDYPGVQTVEDIGNTFNASIDWAYTSIPQANIGNRSIQYHAGRAIGGTSTINGVHLHVHHWCLMNLQKAETSI